MTRNGGRSTPDRRQQRFRVGIVAAIAHHRKLVAAQPGDEILLAHGGAQPVGQAADQLVAGMVAERVVNVLEAVDVDAGDGELVPVALGRLGEGGELRFEQAPVGQAGERVMIGEMLGRGFPGLERAGGGEQPPGQRRNDDDADCEADQHERQYVLQEHQARAPRRPGERAERPAVVGLEVIAAAALAGRAAETEIGQQHVAAGALPIGVVELDEADQDARPRPLQAMSTDGVIVITEASSP